MTHDPSSDRPRLVARPLDEVRAARGTKRVALQRSKVATLRAFRRVKTDRTVGILGVVLLVAVLVLIYTWPKPEHVEKKFGVDWPEVATALPEKNETLAEGASKDYTFTVSQPNVTRVTFWLAWKDDIGDQPQAECDNFTLEVTGPAGTNVKVGAPAGSRCGGRDGENMTFTFPIADIPPISEVPGANEAEARRVLGDRTNQTGVGDWKVKLTLVAAGDDYQQDAFRGRPCTPATFCTSDPGNAYTFHFEYSTYSASFRKLF